MSDPETADPETAESEAATEALAATAEREAEESAEWWNAEWLKFPTVSLDEQGEWHYWVVAEDSGVYKDDWRLGEDLARDTVAHMQHFEAGSTVLRRIMREIDHQSTVAQGFLTRIEDMLTRPKLYLASLEPGAVRRALGEERALEPDKPE